MSDPFQDARDIADQYHRRVVTEIRRMWFCVGLAVVVTYLWAAFALA